MYQNACNLSQQTEKTTQPALVEIIERLQNERNRLASYLDQLENKVFTIYSPQSPKSLSETAAAPDHDFITNSNRLISLVSKENDRLVDILNHFDKIV